MTSHRPSLDSRRGHPSVPIGSLRALQLIETVADGGPLTIVPIILTQGTATAPEQWMAAKVRWAERAHYSILTRDIPESLAPYNAVIRISRRGTEDRQRDYLAHFVTEQEAEA